MIFLLFTLSFASLYAQDATEELTDSIAGDGPAPTLATETILKISPTKKVFALSNLNKTFQKGDFVSLLLEQKLVCRAVVAKDEEEQSGIKILKIYSLKRWNTLKESLEVQVLRGDDSYFKPMKKVEKKEEDPEGKIQSDEDLFNKTTLLDEDLTLEENSKRLLKTDNLLTIAYSGVPVLDKNRDSTYNQQFMGAWAYQMFDNFWAEAVYGRGLIKDFPTEGLDTIISNYTLRIKYTVALPFYAYLQPYAGVQMITASSPGAGKNAAGQIKTQAQLNEESSLVSEQQKTTPVFGGTVIKRLVPGWFLRLDAGTDLIAGGLSLEF